MKKIATLILILGVAIKALAQVIGPGDWTSVRLYGHAYNVGGFTDEEYDWIENHNYFFTTEKRHANNIHGNPSTEYASGLVAEKIIANNSQVQPLFYWNSSKVFESIYQTITDVLSENPDWTFENAGFIKWDYSKAAFREWWVNVVQDQVNNTSHRGVFIDAVPNVAGSLGTTSLNYLHGMMGQLPGLVIYNGFYTTGNGSRLAGFETLEHTDGVFIETFMNSNCNTPDRGKNLLDELLLVPNDKIIIANYKPTEEWNSIDHKFGLACYLIIANDNSFFRYADKFDYSSGQLLNWNADFGEYLGAPKAKATVDGYVYTRTFENAEVRVDLLNKTSSIIWGPTQVNDGVNLAINGKVSQSSTAFEGEASRAIDGDTNGLYSGKSVTHTEPEENAYWQVVLDKDYAIGAINVFGRTDACCKERLSNFTVLIYNSAGERVFWENINSFPDPSITVNANGVMGNLVRIRSNTGQALSLAEVEVYEYATNVSTTMVHITKRNATGYAIDGNWAGENAQNVYLYSQNPNNVNQQWLEIDRGNGYYTYQKVNTDFALDGGGVDDNGDENVYLYALNSTNYNQHWQKVDVGGGAFKLIMRSDPSLAIDGGSGGSNRQNVGLWDSLSNSQNLHWIITPVASAKDVETVETNEVLIYPNPVGSTTTIVNAADAVINIYDMNGSIVFTKIISSKSETIDLSNLTTGMYYTEVVGSTRTSLVKLIKN